MTGVPDMTDQPTAGVALKPCPHCGGERAHTFYVRDGRQAGCPDCGARSGSAFHGRADQPSAEERAIAAWNTRTPASGPVEADDRLAVAPYDRGRRDILNALLALNPTVAERLRVLKAEGEPNPEGKLPFDVVFWVTSVAEQLGIEPREDTLSGKQPVSDPYKLDGGEAGE